MFRHLFCLSLLFFGGLVAESIDNIEFQLPAQQGWRVEEEIANSLGMAQIYLPQDDPFVDTFELFSAQLFHVPFVNDKPEEFGQWMQIAFPFFALHSNLVESSEDSTTMEIFGFENGQLEMYSLFRRIRSDNGTVLLSYSIDKGLEAEKNRNLWIQTLLNAKPIAH